MPCRMDPRSLRVIQNAYFSLLTHTKELLLVTFCDATYNPKVWRTQVHTYGRTDRREVRNCYSDYLFWPEKLFFSHPDLPICKTVLIEGKINFQCSSKTNHTITTTLDYVALIWNRNIAKTIPIESVLVEFTIFNQNCCKSECIDSSLLFDDFKAILTLAILNLLSPKNHQNQEIAVYCVN